MKIKDVEMALKLFESAAVAHAEASEKGDYKKANKNYVILEKAITFLRDHGRVQLLTKFLSHEDMGIRVWAATYLLPTQENIAVKVLEAIASGPSGIQRLDAETTLSEWRKGNL
jgi:hypothetical protein